jgi:hypothetical protein
MSENVCCVPYLDFSQYLLYWNNLLDNARATFHPFLFRLLDN